MLVSELLEAPPTEAQPRPPRVLDSLARLKQRADEAKARSEQQAARSPVQLFLPGMDELMRAMPNQVARSSLFAPVARGRRKQHEETPLVTRSDAVMSYTGEQLDEADADIALQLIFEAKARPLGQPVTVNRAALLRAMGRHTSASQYQWLMARIKALTVATLFVETKRPDGSMKYRVGHVEAFHIVQNFAYDPSIEAYTFTLDPRWAALFGNREYALLDWEKRKQIGRGQDMAKALQRLVATSCDLIQRYSLEWLKEKMQYTGRMRDFREAVTRAALELERLDIIASSKVEVSTKGREQLSMWLIASA